ncbi:hypothetical protein AMECASPLE_016710 [Ameca splendens]|uniref:Uncharacterized protein n=1 Tax=Ameca splendens TaxID=208324 RepID=A0ABV0YDB5_9TELE
MFQTRLSLENEHQDAVKRELKKLHHDRPNQCSTPQPRLPCCHKQEHSELLLRQGYDSIRAAHRDSIISNMNIHLKMSHWTKFSSVSSDLCLSKRDAALLETVPLCPLFTTEC